ncbi:MOSC domain-containing protein [soil metagenome]
MSNTRVELVSVNVAKPGYLGERRGRMVESGIFKKPVENDGISISLTNLAGDGQADLRNHGGLDKAVYAYPVDHLPAWTRELQPDSPFGPGSFGENLSTSGWLESAVFIGDVWQWGDAVLQVSQPRYPCFKLGMSLNRPRVVKAMVNNARTGWYLRVLEPGAAPIAGPISVIEHGEGAISVTEAHLARLPHAAFELIERVASAPALAQGLRQGLREALETPVAP